MEHRVSTSCPVSHPLHLGSLPSSPPFFLPSADVLHQPGPRGTSWSRRGRPACSIIRSCKVSLPGLGSIMLNSRPGCSHCPVEAGLSVTVVLSNSLLNTVNDLSAFCPCIWCLPLVTEVPSLCTCFCSSHSFSVTAAWETPCLAHTARGGCQPDGPCSSLVGGPHSAFHSWL